MKIAVLSDIHDNIWKLDQALQVVKGVETMLFCGDFCAPFTLQQIGEGFSGPVHAVFGNNDGDRHLLTKVGQRFSNLTLHGEFAQLRIGQKKIAINHYPEIATAIASSKLYDAVFYGHNHEHRIARVGKTDLINPGEIMGRFGKSTLVIYDTDNGNSQTVEI